MATATKVKTAEQIRREKGAVITAGLKAVGIQATVSRPDRDPHVFTLRMTEADAKTIRVWPGDSDVEVIGDKTHKQAVINVREKARKVERIVTGSSRITLTAGKKVTINAATAPGRESIKQQLIRSFPVAFPDPDAVKYTFADFQDTTPAARLLPGDDWKNFQAKVTADVPESRMSFLVGFDELAAFISMLPQQRVTSVERAHKILRPPGLSAKALRQGEWFFDPAPKRLQKALDEMVLKRPDIIDRPEELGDDTTHWAVQIWHEEENWASGWVTDRRGDNGWGRKRRESHHPPLFLDGWHKVVRNLEEEPPRALAGASRTWD